MIRTRLAIAFSALALLALAQSVFAWWAASTAAHHAERSVNATRMLAEYLEISGNKQRLKVWFAQRMLANDPAPDVRDALMESMLSSLEALRELAEAAPAETRVMERREVETVALNIATMDAAIQAAELPGAELTPAEQWRRTLLAFDELAGRDMRMLLREAVNRHESASLEASAELSKALARVRQYELLLAFSVCALAFVLVAYFVRRLDRPFADLTRLSSALAAGDFSARSRVSGRDEFARIGSLLDSMAERLAAAQSRSQQLQQQLDELVAERTRALSHAYETLLGIEARRRQFFAELSHELRTPATVIRGEAEVALRNRGDREAQSEALARIIDATSELGGRIQDLLDAAKGGPLEYALNIRTERLHDIVDAAVQQMQAVAEHRDLRLEFDTRTAQADCCVDADRERLQQALVILLDNALRYSPGGARVRVEIASDSEHWLINIDDEGPGMSSAELERAFEPNYRGAAGVQHAPLGQGLGLAIALRIVQGLAGSIELFNREGGGLRASIALPISPAEGNA
ncbi:MAG: HAMP domain-containing histidine kinase [Xanthomonadales bacterium]|nr:HAMP domain-containing histidine kinase [Xanthomonadales bacterium]